MEPIKRIRDLTPIAIEDVDTSQSQLVLRQEGLDEDGNVLKITPLNLIKSIFGFDSDNRVASIKIFDTIEAMRSADDVSIQSAFCQETNLVYSYSDNNTDADNNRTVIIPAGLTGGFVNSFDAQTLLTVLTSRVDVIDSLLTSDDVTLDEFQEIVNFIKANRGDIDALGISSVLGLQTVLDGLQSAIDSEQNARESAIVDLQDDLSNEATARAAGDAVSQTLIDNEATARAQNDAALQTLIDNEAAARSANDATLQTLIDNESTARAQNDGALQAIISNEASARSQNDTLLQEQIDGEVTAREQADNNLQDQLDDLGEQISSGSGAGSGTGDLLASNNLSELTNTTAARANLGLDQVNNTPDTEKPISSSTQAALDSEATARAAGDAASQTLIDNEATARAQNDSALQTLIDNEATARAQNDAALQTVINNEASARSQNDNLLQGQIDTEVAAREQAVNNLQTQLNNKASATSVSAVSDIVDNLKSGIEVYGTITDLKSREAVTADDSGRFALVDGIAYVLTNTLVGTKIEGIAADEVNVLALNNGGFAVVDDVFRDGLAGDFITETYFTTNANPTFIEQGFPQEARSNFLQTGDNRWTAREFSFNLIASYADMVAAGQINAQGFPTEIPAGADYVQSVPLFAAWRRFPQWARDLGPIRVEFDGDMDISLHVPTGNLTQQANASNGDSRYEFHYPTTHNDFVYINITAIRTPCTRMRVYPANVDPDANGGWSPWFLESLRQYMCIRSLDLTHCNAYDIISVDQINTMQDYFWGARKRTPQNLQKMGIPNEAVFSMSEAAGVSTWHHVPARLGASEIFDDENLPGSRLFFPGTASSPYVYTDYCDAEAQNILDSNQLELFVQDYYNALHNASPAVKSLLHYLEWANEVWNHAPGFHLMTYIAKAIGLLLNPAWSQNSTFEFDAGGHREAAGYMTARMMVEFDRLQALNGTNYKVSFVMGCQTVLPGTLSQMVDGFEYYCDNNGINAATKADMLARCQSFGTGYWSGALSDYDPNGNLTTPPLWAMLGRSSWAEIESDINSGALTAAEFRTAYRNFYDRPDLPGYQTIPAIRANHLQLKTIAEARGLGSTWGLAHAGNYEGGTHDDEAAFRDATETKRALFELVYLSEEMADVDRALNNGFIEDHGHDFMLSNYPINAPTDDGAENGGQLGKFAFFSGFFTQTNPITQMWKEFPRRESLDSPAIVQTFVPDTSGDTIIGTGEKISFPVTVNGSNREITLRAVGRNLLFSKPNIGESSADFTRYEMEGVGGLNGAGDPFWRGLHLSCPTIKENGANRFPRISFYWSFSSFDDPSDLTFNFRPASTGSLPARIAFRSNNGGEIYFDGGNVRIGNVGGPATSKLTVDGAIRPKSYTVANVPSASAEGKGAIIYVDDESGGPTMAFSDGANWRRCTDGAVVS